MHPLKHFTPVAAALAAFALSLEATTNPVGGGILDAGLQGAYYSDTAFGGEAFTRRDIRLDFDWGELIKPGGGMPWTKHGQLAADNYSVRWEGRLMARFSETYTLKAWGDSVRVWIKPEGAAWGAPLIDYWPASDPASYAAQTAAFAFIAGAAYEIKVEYRERTGAALLRLLWSSPSTPEEVIQPTAMVGDIPPERGIVLADALYGASNWGESNPSALRDGVLSRDADGWPTEDFNFLIRPQDRDVNPGTYLLRYKGSSKLRVHLTNGTQIYSADGLTLYGNNTKTAAQGYDAATNTTTVRIVIAAGQGNCWPTFEETDRDGPGGATYGTYSGLTDLQLMRPASQGGAEPHGFDEWIARDTQAMLETFVTFRWNDVNGLGDVEWADRKLLKDRNFYSGYTNENHEYKILLNNHTGRDLYLQVPAQASDDYVRKLAQLLKYGSDQNGAPYASPQADPYHPPLNPNLRVNLEYSNESPWNTAGQYAQNSWMQAEPERLRQAWLANPASADGRRFAALNYDGAYNPASTLSGIGPAKRFFAMRTVEISAIFREVFGDDAMPAPGKNDPRIRPLLMYQYDNYNDTARDALFFIDNYYNKTDPASTYAGTPHPVNYHIYGGGAATYYASADRHGIETGQPLVASGEGSFETPVLADGQAATAPAGSPWTFAGTAGIYAQAARAAASLGAPATPTSSVDTGTRRGFKFTVGAQNVAVYEVGRYVHSGNSQSHTLEIYDADGALYTRRMSLNLNLGGKPAGQVAWIRAGQVIFVMANKYYNWPVILEAGRSYYFVSTETNGGDTHSGPSAITPPSGITIDGAVKGYSESVDGATVWHWTEEATADRTYGPLNLKIATQPVQTAGPSPLVLGFLQDPRDGLPTDGKGTGEETFSRQAVFLAGMGTADYTLTVAEPGWYALIYGVAHKRSQQPWNSSAPATTNNLDIFLVDGGATTRITPASQADVRPGTGAWVHSTYWAKADISYDFFGSAPFYVSTPGKVLTFRFSGSQASTDRVVMIDDVRLASSARMTAGTIPSGGGFAEGAPDVSNWEARVMSMYKYVQSFGMKAVSYEGGWYPGGDANKMPLQYQSSFFDPAMVTGEMNAINALARAGLAVNTDYTREFALPYSGIADAGAYARIQAWRALNAGLAAEPTNGLPVNSTLSHTSLWWSNKQSGATLQPGGWISWNVIAPQTGLYLFRVETTPGGTIEVLADEAYPVVNGPSGGVLENTAGVFLTKGLHNIRAKASGGAFDVLGVAGALPGQLFGLTGLAAFGGDARITASWPAVSGAEGYNVYYKPRTETVWTKFNATPIPSNGVNYVISPLPNDASYNVVVTYITGGIESAYSNQVTVAAVTGATVSNGDDSGPGSLRNAVEVAATGATIVFEPGVTHVSLTSGEILIDKSLTIDGKGAVTISANGASRIFNVNGAATIDVFLDGLVLENGYASGNGGAITVDTESLTIRNCLIRDSVATADGGAIWANSAVVSLTIEDSTVTGCSAGDQGGAVATNGTLTVRRSTLSGNSAGGEGGALYGFFNSTKLWTLADTVIADNTSSKAGAGIYLDRLQLRMERCTISGNSTSGGDGAGMNHGLTLAGSLIADSTFSGNTLGGSTTRTGAGLRTGYEGNLTILRSTFSGNQNNSSGGDGGGASFVGEGQFTLVNSTFSGNTATDDGPGLHVNNAQSYTAVRACTVTGNSGDQGDGIWLQAGAMDILNSIVHGNGNEDLRGAFRRIEHSLYGTTASTTIAVAAANIVGQDPLLGPLADNGGHTRTHLPAANSPVIDAGVAAAVFSIDDRHAQLADLTALAGVTIGTNTDPDGYLHASIVDTTGAATSYRLDLYRDAARAQLVGSTGTFTKNTGSQVRTVAAANGSGLGGTVTMNTNFTPVLEFMKIVSQSNFQNITGVTAANTDANGMLYITHDEVVDNTSVVAWYYRDAAKTELVAHTAQSGNGTVAIIPDNGSGLGGSVTFTRVDFDTYGYAKMTPASNGIRALATPTDQRGPGFARVAGMAADIGALENFFASATPYELWAAAIDWKGADNSGTGNPDRDSLINLLEFALGGDPLDTANCPLPQLQVPGQRVHLTFRRARGELTYFVEASANLSGWSVIATNPGVPGADVTVSDTVDLSPSNPSRFLRLRVEE